MNNKNNILKWRINLIKTEVGWSVNRGEQTKVDRQAENYKRLLQEKFNFGFVEFLFWTK